MADFILSKVDVYLVAPIESQLGYLFNYDSNVEDLKNQLDKLEEVKSNVKRDIDDATRNGEETKPVVEKWLTSVNRITEVAEKFLVNEKKAKKRCFYELCPNLKSIYQLSKKARKTTEEVALKIQDGEKFDKVAYTGPPPRDRGSALAKCYEAFESRMSTFNEIMKALRNPSINVIGVYGMGGVGKTMLVKEVVKKAKEDKLFEEVVMVVVTQPPNIRKIQGEIAYTLGLRFGDQECDSERKDRLCARLKKNKTILIILDGIWVKLDLEAIGIPFGDDDHKGRKLVMTSRSQHVLSNEMNTQKNFGIGVLLEEEAWNLFKKMMSDAVEAPKLKPTAIEVAKECAGLPLAITTIANALKNNSLPVWEDALLQLRSSTPTNISGVDATVYSSLKLSYNSLESEEAKLLLLLCSLLPEGCHISIHDFLKYGKGLGLFQGCNTLEKERNRARTLVHHLKASCLLLDSNATKFVRVHDVVRDVGVSIASKEKHMFIVSDGVKPEEWPEEILRNCPAISLPGSDIQELPTTLECPKLKLLFLLSKNRSLKIPDKFFEGMKQLKVLNLTNMCFSSLPSSLYLLSNLQTLCLEKCVLRDIARIGELEKLEVLSFASSNIRELPREIGQLTRLKMLDLGKCSKLKIIPSNVIASLSQLEDLHMGGSFVKWEVGGNASLAELNHLSRLVTLDLHIPDAKSFPKDLHFKKLIRYRISIGGVWDWSVDYETSRTLKLKLSSSTQQEGIKLLLKTAEDLYLDALNGIRGDLYNLNREGFTHLKHLHVQRSCEMEYLINTMEWYSSRAFPNLESLFLHNLNNLKEICYGQLQGDSFCNLRTVEVMRCGRLKSLFPVSMARCLSQLQKLKINECKIVEGIVAGRRAGSESNNEAEDKMMFPQLHSLILQNLPRLKGFCSEVVTMPSLNFAPTTDARLEEIISEAEHDIPTPLFNDKVAFSNLEELTLFRLSSMKEIWQGQFNPRSFCKLRVVKVLYCDKILKIFPINLLQNLQNLEELEVCACSSLEETFQPGGGVFGEAVITPLLRKLRLIELPRLMHLWKKDSQISPVFQNLTTLEVRWCGSLTHLLPSAMAKSLVQIKSIIVWDCKTMKEIIASEDDETANETTFSHLNSLKLTYLPNLTSFCSGSNHFSFPSLKEVSVIKCPKLKTFSDGILSTPQLEKVCVDWSSKWAWKGNLNTTIQDLFAQKDSQNLG